MKNVSIKDAKHVKGKNVGKVLLYALSTHVDLLNGAKKEKVEKEVKRWNPRVSFPTLVINGDNGDICIVGHQEDEIKRALG